MKKLSKYLEQIGHEIYDTGFLDDKGTIRAITRDEALAREIWRRALGYVTETTNSDGSKSNRYFPPDPKAQAFIFERREGKVIPPTEEKSITLLEKISELAKSQLNRVAEKVVEDDRDDPQSESA